MFDIFYIGNNPELKEHLPTARQIAKRNEVSPITRMYWVISENIEILDYEIFNFRPPVHDQNYKHVWKRGGVELIPKTKQSGIKEIDSIVCKTVYERVYTKTPEDYFQKNPSASHVWCVDPDYILPDSIDWAPNNFEPDYIHSFHLNGQLAHKYPEEEGGIKLYPKNWKDANIKFHGSLTLSIKYPIIYTGDVSDYNQRQYYKDDYVWLIDKDYQVDENTLDYIPSVFEKEQIHSFHLANQLKHKYPEAMGGIRLVPVNWKKADINIHAAPLTTEIIWEKFSTLDEGRANSSHNWFWVIEPGVEVNDNFDWGFQPSVFDKVTHVWQKLNPKTDRVYDYGGVSLHPKDESSKSRPKYMRQPASKQREYPIYYLALTDYDQPLQSVYERLSNETNTDMYWVVDVYTQISPSFAFDYYPTQWDTKNVHIFAADDGKYKNVRLVPKDLFLERSFSDEEIENNSFETLKLINTIASLKPKWPVINLPQLNKEEFIHAIKSVKEPFVWTIDSDVKVNQDILDEGFAPPYKDLRKVHTWQKINELTGQVHSYGGLRLWPTNEDYSSLTTSALKLNRLKNLFYVREAGSLIKPHDVVFISYYDISAEEKFEALKKQLPPIMNLIWVKDIDGIFNAHKEAANRVSTEMFWVVDADAIISNDFKFSYLPDVYDKDVVHVWASKNPVNNLEYGYGGVKLFPTNLVRDASSWGLDFTTGLSTRFKSIPEVSCVTAFNTSEFHTWKSAFRECVKLSVSTDADAPARLAAWLSPNDDAAFSSFAKIGAKQGNEFGIQYKSDVEQLNNINNFDWLKTRFNTWQESH